MRELISDAIANSTPPLKGDASDPKSDSIGKISRGLVETGRQLVIPGQASIQQEIQRTEREALRLLLNVRVTELQGVREQEKSSSDVSLVSRAEGLEKELEFILRAIGDLDSRIKDAALDYYTLEQLAVQPESSRLEFKATARWNTRTNKHDPRLEIEWMKTVAGFLNTDGGDLLIGVEDDGRVRGVEDDLKLFQTSKHDPADQFQNYLVTKLGSCLGMDVAQSVSVTTGPLNERIVCRIEVRPSPRPMYLSVKDDTDFYVRFGNTTRRLDVQETVAYVLAHWDP
jgi:hypothetical protein